MSRRVPAGLLTGTLRRGPWGLSLETQKALDGVNCSPASASLSEFSSVTVGL